MSVAQFSCASRGEGDDNSHMACEMCVLGARKLWFRGQEPDVPEDDEQRDMKGNIRPQSRMPASAAQFGRRIHASSSSIRESSVADSMKNYRELVARSSVATTFVKSRHLNLISTLTTDPMELEFEHPLFLASRRVLERDIARHRPWYAVATMMISEACGDLLPKGALFLIWLYAGESNANTTMYSLFKRSVCDRSLSLAKCYHQVPSAICDLHGSKVKGFSMSEGPNPREALYTWQAPGNMGRKVLNLDDTFVRGLIDEWRKEVAVRSIHIAAAEMAADPTEMLVSVRHIARAVADFHKNVSFFPEIVEDPWAPLELIRTVMEIAEELADAGELRVAAVVGCSEILRLEQILKDARINPNKRHDTTKPASFFWFKEWSAHASKNPSTALARRRLDCLRTFASTSMAWRAGAANKEVGVLFEEWNPYRKDQEWKWLHKSSFPTLRLRKGWKEARSLEAHFGYGSIFNYRVCHPHFYKWSVGLRAGKWNIMAARSEMDDNLDAIELKADVNGRSHIMLIDYGANRSVAGKRFVRRQKALIDAKGVHDPIRIAGVNSKAVVKGKKSLRDLELVISKTRQKVKCAVLHIIEDFDGDIIIGFKDLKQWLTESSMVNGIWIRFKRGKWIRVRSMKQIQHKKTQQALMVATRGTLLAEGTSGKDVKLAAAVLTRVASDASIAKARHRLAMINLNMDYFVEERKVAIAEVRSRIRALRKEEAATFASRHEVGKTHARKRRKSEKEEGVFLMRPSFQEEEESKVKRLLGVPMADDGLQQKEGELVAGSPERLSPLQLARLSGESALPPVLVWSSEAKLVKPILKKEGRLTSPRKKRRISFADDTDFGDSSPERNRRDFFEKRVLPNYALDRYGSEEMDEHLFEGVVNSLFPVDDVGVTRELQQQLRESVKRCVIRAVQEERTRNLNFQRRSRRDWFNPRPKQQPWDAERQKAYIKGIWGTEPYYFRQKKHAVAKLRKLRDRGKFPIVLEANHRATWWGDVIDRMIDVPLPIPSKQRFTKMAFLLGTREDARKWRASKAKNIDTLLVTEQVYAIPGEYHPDTKQVYEFLIERLRTLAMNDEKTWTQPSTPDDEDPGDNRGDWYPIKEEEKVDVDAVQKDLMAKIRKAGTIDQDMQYKVAQMFKENKEIFKQPEFGSVKDFMCTIETKPDIKPFTSKCRIGRSKFEEEQMTKELRELWKRGFIEESRSPIASNLKMVPKSNGSLRLCTNLRRANELVKPVQAVFPTFQEAFTKIKKANYYSVIDLKSGFWQLQIEESSRWVTAFEAPAGLFQWTVLPFGLKTAPALFTQAIQRMLGPAYTNGDVGPTSEFAFAYIDDIIIWSQTAEEHMKHLQDIFRRLKEFGLKVAGKKCEFFQKKVNYLGHVVSNGKWVPNPDKVKVIAEYPLPQTVAKLHTFIATAGFYNAFIPGFAKSVEPLRRMVNAMDMTWTKSRIRAFEKIRADMSNIPQLYTPDFDRKFFLETDASAIAIGAVLYQLQGDPKMDEKTLVAPPKESKRPVMWMGRRLSKAERNYCTREQELLAVVWAIEKSRDFIYGRKFTVFTDHLNLTFLYDNDACGRVARWAMKLAAYDFDIRHIRGKDNVVADTLSRRVYLASMEFSTGLDVRMDDEEGWANRQEAYECRKFQSVATAIVASFHELKEIVDIKDVINKKKDVNVLCACGRNHLVEEARLADDLWEEISAWNNETPCEVEAEDDMEEKDAVFSSVHKVREASLKLGGMHLEDWDKFVEFTEQDPELGPLAKHLKEPHKFLPRGKFARPAEKKKYEIEEGIIFRRKRRTPENSSLADNREGFHVVVPEKLRRTAIALAHSYPMGGHMGEKRLLAVMNDKFWWPNITNDIKDFVSGCFKCKMAKTPLPKNRGFLGEYRLIEEPFAMIHVDHVGPFKQNVEGNSFVLMVVDRATGFVVPIPVPDVTAKTTAKALYDRIFCVFGIPRRVISDKGTAFENVMCEYMAKRMGIKWNFCSSQNPRSNGIVERMNRVLKETLMTFCMKQQTRWQAVLAPFAFSANTSNSRRLENKATPFELVFARKARAAIDLKFDRAKFKTVDEQLAYVIDFRAKARKLLEAIYKKKQLNHTPEGKFRHVEFKKGDWVLLWNDSFPTGVTRKLTSHWEGPYMVLRQTAAYNYVIWVKGKEQFMLVVCC